MEPITFLPPPRDQQVETPLSAQSGVPGDGPKVSAQRGARGANSLSLGTGSTGAVDLLWVLFKKKKKKKIYFFEERTAQGLIPVGLGQLPDCCFNLKKIRKSGTKTV